MLRKNEFTKTKSFYIVKYSYLSLNLLQLVLHASQISLVFILFANLQLFGSLYYIYTYYLQKTIICLSIIAIILSVIGLLSSAKNFRNGIILCGALIYLLVITEIALSIIYIYYIQNDVVGNILEKELYYHFNLYNNQTNSHDIIDNIQENLRCCGVVGPKNYDNGTFVVIPVSCCPEKKCLSITSVYFEGCLSKLLSKNIFGLVFIYLVYGMLIFSQLCFMLISIIYSKKLIDLAH